MRGFKRMLGISLMLLLAVPMSAFAEQKAAPTLDKKEIKELHKEVLEPVSNGQEDQVSKLPLYQKYQSIFSENPEIAATYYKNLDVNNKQKVADTANQTIFTKNSKEFRVFPDGSFIVKALFN